jgi:hypothetical protein
MENNVCGVGYKQVELCTLCESGYYRNSGVCTKCPSMNFFLLGFVMVLAIYVLHKLTKITEITRWVGSFRIFATFVATSVPAGPLAAPRLALTELVHAFTGVHDLLPAAVADGATAVYRHAQVHQHQPRPLPGIARPSPCPQPCPPHSEPARAQPECTVSIAVLDTFVLTQCLPFFVVLILYSLAICSGASQLRTRGRPLTRSSTDPQCTASESSSSATGRSASWLVAVREVPALSRSRPAAQIVRVPEDESLETLLRKMSSAIKATDPVRYRELNLTRRDIRYKGAAAVRATPVPNSRPGEMEASSYVREGSYHVLLAGEDPSEHAARVFFLTAVSFQCRLRLPRLPRRTREPVALEADARHRLPAALRGVRDHDHPSAALPHRELGLRPGHARVVDAGGRVHHHQPHTCQPGDVGAPAADGDTGPLPPARVRHGPRARRAVEAHRRRRLTQVSAPCRGRRAARVELC